jgi:Ni/Co efflux regulator RcnB
MGAFACDRALTRRSRKSVCANIAVAVSVSAVLLMGAPALAASCPPRGCPAPRTAPPPRSPPPTYRPPVRSPQGPVNNNPSNGQRYRGPPAGTQYRAPTLGPSTGFNRPIGGPNPTNGPPHGFTRPSPGFRGGPTPGSNSTNGGPRGFSRSSNGSTSGPLAGSNSTNGGPRGFSRSSNGFVRNGNRSAHAAFFRRGRPLRGHGLFSYHGHRYARFLGPRYFWPAGYFYSPYAVGAFLPLVFLSTDYVVVDYADYDLEAPPPDYEWVRYGPDLLLVDVNSGEVDQVIQGVFDESDPPPDADADADADQEAPQ